MARCIDARLLVAMGSQYAKRPLQAAKYARNGKFPDAQFAADLADYANRCALFRMKQLAHFLAPAAPARDSDRVRWRFAFRSSPYANCILVRAWIAPTNTDGGAPSPYVRVRIEDTTPTTIGDAELHYGGGSTELNVPDAYGELTTFVASAPGTIAAITPNTEYRGTISDINFARCVAITVWEGAVDSSAPFVEGFAAGTPIFDADRAALLTGARAMWKQQASQLFTWSVDLDANARVRSSATSINAVDGTSMTTTNSTPGWLLDLRRRSTIRRLTVPVELAVYASAEGAGTGVVSLKNLSGADEITINVTGGPGWYTGVGELPASLAKYDLHLAGDGTNDCTLYAASLYQYESGT